MTEQEQVNDCGTCGICGEKMPPNYEPCSKCGNNGLVIYQ